jgi:hypothetical protein
MSISLNTYGGMRLAVRTWRQHRRDARIYAARRRICADLGKSFAALCDMKCYAMKKTGVFKTDHEHLEAAIVALARALEDYRDGV